jgi:hypothetical protein
MHLYKPAIQGTYKPTFFSLVINRENVLDADNRLKSEFGNIFFHEYIHFLQDILTSFGLRNIATLAREYSIINQEIIELPTSDFSIPYVSKNESLELEKELFRLIWGTQALDNDDVDFEVIDCHLEPYILNEKLANHNLVVVDILYRSSLEKDSFYLGAIHFLENMAYILDRNFSYEFDAVPYPYEVIEKIIKSRFIDGEHTASNYIMIIENSLESHDPANYFYNYCEFCINSNQTFSHSTIQYFRNTYRQTWDGKVYTYDKFYYQNAVLARHAFKVMFNHHDSLKTMNEWAEIVIANSIKLKRHDFSFVDLLVTNGNHKKVVDYTGRLIKKLGTPIMSDKNNQLFYATPESKIPAQDMLYLLGLEAIINVINGDTNCCLLPYCRHGQGGSDITNDLCYTSPWQRSKTPPLCIFGKLWIIWGFVRKDVQA